MTRKDRASSVRHGEHSNATRKPTKSSGQGNIGFQIMEYSKHPQGRLQNIKEELDSKELSQQSFSGNDMRESGATRMVCKRSDVSIGDVKPSPRRQPKYERVINEGSSGSITPVRSTEATAQRERPTTSQRERQHRTQATQQRRDVEMRTNIQQSRANNNNNSSSNSNKNNQRDKTIDHAEFTNRPHPSLEYPPLYWVLKQFPMLLEAVRPIYHFRWSLAHPLQKRVVFSQALRKMGIFMTWGELLFLLPFIGMLLGGTIFTFVAPSVANTGKFARLALIFAVGTAMRNSLFTLVLGMPFERTLWYHKLSGRIAFVNGIFHTVVAYVKPISGLTYDTFSVSVLQNFLFGNVINASGTFLAFLITGVVATSLPYVRKKCFEVFYYVHVVFVAIMAICALYHSGIMVPTLVALFWGVDLMFRKIIMAGCKYSTKATINIISETVVEIRFPKQGFDYNPGQHLSIAVPDISLFEWHPFSISTCPRQKYVSVHIRKAGNWTTALYDLAKIRQGAEVSILVEGPNGSPEIDFLSDGPNNRYKSVLLISGGIGITPIQSICNQLVYEHSKGLRDINRIRLVWTERDPILMEGLDIAGTKSNHYKAHDLELGSVASHRTGSTGWGDYNDDISISTAGIASTLLSLMPPSHRTDRELAEDYPSNYLDVSDTHVEAVYNGERRNRIVTSDNVSLPADRSIAESTYQAAFNFEKNTDMVDIFDLQVYITSKDATTNNPALASLPFVHLHRPDFKKIFSEAREEAIANKINDVAVIVCAPARLAHICKKACVKYSDSQVEFGFHMEYQD